MDAWRYGIYRLVFTSISNEWAQRTSEISMWTIEDKFHISARPCIILYWLDNNNIVADKLSVSVFAPYNTQAQFKSRTFHVTNLISI